MRFGTSYLRVSGLASGVFDGGFRTELFHVIVSNTKSWEMNLQNSGSAGMTPDQGPLAWKMRPEARRSRSAGMRYPNLQKPFPSIWASTLETPT